MQFDNKIRMKIIIADRVMVIITVCHISISLWYATESTQDLTDSKLKFISIPASAWPPFYYDL